MSSREKLFRYKHIYDPSGSESLFLAAMRESVRYHTANNNFYQRLIQSKNYQPGSLRSIDDLPLIPAVPVNFFKYHEIRSIPINEVAVHATSSGTFGQKSQVFLSKSDLRLGTRMAFMSMKYHGFISVVPTNYILLGYEPNPANAMGNVKVLTGMTRLAPAKEITFALKSIGSSYQIDLFGILSALKRYAKQPFPVRIFGFPAYLYRMLDAMNQSGMKPLKLGRSSLVFTGGGWKNYGDQQIDQSMLYEMVEKQLGIPKANCRDFYSAVEHSVAYPQCKYHHMHVPIWSRVIIRDIKTLAPVGYDTPGFLSFVSPLISGMPLNSVIMGDIAILKRGSQCSCGIKTPYFEILGRAGTGGGKSCAVTAAELLGGNHGTFI